MAGYKLLVRLFNDQCVLEKTDGDAARVVVKPNKEVSSASLQNPSDPDAGYCGHKGKGFQEQAMETYSPEKSQPNLITHVQVEAAHESDANVLLPAIAEAAKRELAPTQLLADSLYGGDDNLEKAKELGVEIVSPVIGAAPGGISLARRRAQEKTEAFCEGYRFCAGAEATMSDLDRVTGIKHLLRQVRLAAVLKATGLNILRATVFRNRQKPKKPGGRERIFPQGHSCRFQRAIKTAAGLSTTSCRVFSARQETNQ